MRGSLSVKKLLPPMWNDIEQDWDDRPRNVEENVELRRRKKRLDDCELPSEFRLVHAEPKQYWLNSQLRWGFCLAWARVDGNGRRGAEECFYVARYEPRVSDEIQMRWALDDFSRELEYADTARGMAKTKVPLLFTMKVAS